MDPQPEPELPPKDSSPATDRPTLGHPAAREVAGTPHKHVDFVGSEASNPRIRRMPEGIPFGRYRLLSLLGEGGMAKVYRAVLSGPMGFEKDVALKRLDPRLTADERLVRSLINEARLGGQLRHKNIVEIYEFNQVAENYYLAMEYVDGWTLDTILMKVRGAYELLPGSVILELLLAICKGLSYAHGLTSREGTPMNLVHRDLKPGNIIVSRTGDVKLLDFGIAKADTNLYKTTAADVTKGTPVYMSPEQVTGQKLDLRSDLFSLGSIVHELVTLDVPFHGDNLLAIMHAVLNAEVAEAVANVADRFPLLGPVMQKCMEKEPEDRYSSAKEIDKELRTIRRQMAPGLSLSEWLEEVGEPILPKSARNGDFGPDGPPRALKISTGEATSVDETADGDDSWQWIGATDADAPAAAGARTYADALEVVDAPPGAPPIGSMTADFFTTDGGSQSRPPPGIAPTRVQKTIGRKGRRKSKKRGSGLLIGVSALALVLSVLVVGLLAKDRFGGDGVTAVDPAPVVDPVADPAPVADPTPAVDEPVAKPDPTPAPVAKPEPTPAPKPVAKPKADPTPAPVAKPDPTPAPVAKPDPTPAPVAISGSGVLNVNSKPWSNLYLDGRFIGQTPKINYEVPAGRHTLEFHCGSCDPARKESYSFTLQDGGSFKKILRFDPQ